MMAAFGTFRRKSSIDITTTNDADQITDEKLKKQKKGIHLTKRKKGSVIYDTARGIGVVWSAEDEESFVVNAIVTDTVTLQSSPKWEELIQKGVTHLTIKDDDKHLEDIPMNICQLQTLRSLKLMWSRIKAIPEALFHMELTELCLHNCPLTGIDGIHHVRGMASLELVNAGIKAIPIEIGEMTSLRHLDLSGNKIKTLPISIGNLNELRSLNVSGNSMTELSDGLVELENLTRLECSQNQLKKIPTLFGKLRSLCTVRLSHNQLTELPESFKDLNQLKHLSIGHNHFTVVPAVLASLAELQILNMEFNSVSAIPNALPNLTILLLDNNKLRQLPDTLFKSVHLVRLSVQHNELSSIPPEIGTLMNLRALDLEGNNIETLPDEITTLVNLRHLVLRETKIAKLPYNFDRLEHLKLLKIDDTHLNEDYTLALEKRGISGFFEKHKNLRRLSHLEIMRPNDQSQKEGKKRRQTIDFISTKHTIELKNLSPDLDEDDMSNGLSSTSAAHEWNNNFPAVHRGNRNSMYPPDKDPVYRRPQMERSRTNRNTMYPPKPENENSS